MTGASPAFRRFVALGLLFGLVAAIYALAVGPLLHAHERLDEAQQDTQSMLARFERTAHGGAAYQARLDALAADRVIKGLFLDGNTEAGAAAGLQDRVTAIIRARGGTTRSSEVFSSNARNDLTQIAVRVQFTALTAQIQQILHTLESSQPLIFIDNLEIAARNRVNYLQNDAIDPPLQVRMDILGYLRPEPR